MLCARKSSAWGWGFDARRKALASRSETRRITERGGEGGKVIPEVNRIYQGDCLEIMKSWPDQCVDHVITDPPYGEKTHAGARGGDGDIKLIPFQSISQDKFEAITRRLLAVSRRWVIMICEWRHAARLEDSGFPLVRLGVWIKPNGAPQFTGDRPGTGWEAVAILHREGKKRWNGGGIMLFGMSLRPRASTTQRKNL